MDYFFCSGEYDSRRQIIIKQDIPLTERSAISNYKKTLEDTLAENIFYDNSILHVPSLPLSTLKELLSKAPSLQYGMFIGDHHERNPWLSLEDFYTKFSESL